MFIDISEENNTKQDSDLISYDIIERFRIRDISEMILRRDTGKAVAQKYRIFRSDAHNNALVLKVDYFFEHEVKYEIGDDCIFTIDLDTEEGVEKFKDIVHGARRIPGTKMYGLIISIECM